MARGCSFCGEPIGGRSCVPTAAVEDVEYHRVPYNPEYGGAEQRCYACGIERGGFHHAGCDMERCPRCLQQAIACGCRWEKDPPENDEHPEARRLGAAQSNPTVPTPGSPHSSGSREGDRG